MITQELGISNVHTLNALIAVQAKLEKRAREKSFTGRRRPGETRICTFPPTISDGFCGGFVGSRSRLRNGTVVEYTALRLITWNGLSRAGHSSLCSDRHNVTASPTLSIRIEPIKSAKSSLSPNVPPPPARHPPKRDNF